MSSNSLLSDIMNDSTTTDSNKGGSKLIEDEIAIYDDFLEKAGRKPPTSDSSPPNFIVPTMSHIPSQSQLSALSSTSSTSHPPKNVPGVGSNSPSPTANLIGAALGTTVEQEEYGEDFDDHEDDEEYGEDFNDHEEGVFLRIGRMKLTENQAKIYGLKLKPGSKFVKPSYQKKKKTTAKLSVEKLDRIAKPVRKYAGRDDGRFAKESDKVECTFKPSKSKAAVSAMKSSDCGYDFLDNLEKNSSDFIKRMDGFEMFRRKKFRRDQEEQYYESGVDKKQCPNCGQLQSYDEWAEKRGECTGERCSEGFAYCIPNAFMMERFEKRMEKSSKNREKGMKKMYKELNPKVVIQRSKIQQDLLQKISSKNETFEQRMYSDINAKTKKIEEAQKLNYTAFNQECTFTPDLNVDAKWLKNRDPEALYKGKERVDDFEEKKKKKKVVQRVVKKKKGKKAFVGKKVEAVKVEEGGKENEQQMREKFESLLL
ncbi:hypothetical protein TrLO_g6180 [Triparma laevis f. longispina]|uniref:Uncharacterized protein n=1 Tax=Triparma laevis f. longispina TaxID=1714387 RepID=A0A9W7L038_9STRA|nr:hypothetical protein TrLO_g6180 [Triparma laevis f. longispina]